MERQNNRAFSYEVFLRKEMETLMIRLLAVIENCDDIPDEVFFKLRKEMLDEGNGRIRIAESRLRSSK